MEFAHLIYIMCLAFVQNMSFTFVSRARNRDVMWYHAIASVFSNGIWFLVFRELVIADMSWMLIAPYIVGTVCGSLFGAKVAIKLEAKIGALADPHAVKK